MVEYEKLDFIFTALADPTRRGILAGLKKRPQTVMEIAAPWNVSLNAISKHLKMLERADLISRVQRGREHVISLNDSPLIDAANWIDLQRSFWTQSLDRLGAYLEDTTNDHKRNRQHLTPKAIARSRIIKDTKPGTPKTRTRTKRGTNG